MNLKFPGLRLSAALSIAMLVPLAASAQNLAIVNGKPVPKARVELLIDQVIRSGQQQQRSPELEARARDEVVMREIFVQEALKRGMSATPEYKNQMELARQSILIRELFADFHKNSKITEAEARVEYDKVKTKSGGAEYKVSHILVEKEDEAAALIAKIKAGEKFEELAIQHSKDPGSGAKGGDLDFAKPEAYVPEFSAAVAQLKKGEMTQTPVKSQFGYHIIRLDDTRETPFPAFDEVKAQVIQRIGQLKLQEFQASLREKAKTDYKFMN